MSEKTRICVLLSQTGGNLDAVRMACNSGILPDCEVVCVGSDNASALGLDRAHEAGIKTFHIGYERASRDLKGGPCWLSDSLDEMDSLAKMGLENSTLNREEMRICSLVEDQLMNKLIQYNVNLLILARFDKVLTPYFLDYWQPDPLAPRTISISIAPFPPYPETPTYENVLKNDPKVYGPVVHFTGYTLDDSPIIADFKLTREKDASFGKCKSDGLLRGYNLLPACVRLYAQGRLKIEPSPNGKRVVHVLS